MNEEAKRPSETREVILGVLITLGLHLMQLPLLAFGFASVAFVGVSQLVYVVPAAVIAHQKGRKGIMKGIIIGAALTFLLNAACFALVLSALG